MRRPQRGDAVTAALKRSYSAALLLACAAPTGASIEFMSTKAACVLGGVFGAFGPRSAACVAHACRVLNHLADEDMDLVLAVVAASPASVERCVGGLLNEAHDPAAFATLLALLEGVGASAAARWQLVNALAEWRLLVKVAEHVFEGGRPVAHVEVCDDDDDAEKSGRALRARERERDWMGTNSRARNRERREGGREGGSSPRIHGCVLNCLSRAVFCWASRRARTSFWRRWTSWRRTRPAASGSCSP